MADTEFGGFATAQAKMPQRPLDNAITDNRNPWKPYSPTKNPSTETRRFVTTEVRERSPRRAAAAADRPGRYPPIVETRDVDPKHGDDPVDQHHWRPLVALQVPWMYRAPAAENADQPFSYGNAVCSTANPQEQGL